MRRGERKGRRDVLSMRVSVCRVTSTSRSTPSLRHYLHQGMFAATTYSSNSHVGATSFPRATFPMLRGTNLANPMFTNKYSTFSTEGVSATAGLLWGMGML